MRVLQHHVEAKRLSVVVRATVLIGLLVRPVSLILLIPLSWRNTGRIIYFREHLARRRKHPLARLRFKVLGRPEEPKETRRAAS
jgi:hypothetical protein